MILDRRDDIHFSTRVFPAKLYTMLEDAESQGFQDVISWQPGGKSFKIFKPKEFCTTIMQAYFNQTKLKSFQRQLNIYSWKKVQLGPNKGGYMHRLFVKGQPDLCEEIVRRKDAGKPGRTSLRDEQESLSSETTIPVSVPLTSSPMQSRNSNSNSNSNKMVLSDGEVNSFYDFFYPNEHSSSTKLLDDALAIDGSLFSLSPESVDAPISTTGRMTSKSPSFQVLSSDNVGELDGFIALLDTIEDADECECDYYVEPLAGDASFSQEASQMLDDLLMLDQDQPPQLLQQPSPPSSSSSSEATTDSDLSFPFKLHLMLDSASRDNYSHIVSWVDNGTAFKVHHNQAFVDQVMPLYFDQSKYESFRRQLNLYHFKRTAKGVDRGVISHPFLQAGARHLCSKITRITKPSSPTKSVTPSIVPFGGSF